MGAIVSFSNQKGGVGKSTSAVNIAAQIAKNGRKVLLVDLDPQGNATSGLGLMKNKIKKSSYNVIIGQCAAEEAVISTEFANLSVLPSTISLVGAELELQEAENREFALKNALESIKNSYDYIFIDCPPTLGLLTINALTASDGTVIPMQCEFFALEGLSQLLMTIKKVQQLYNPALEITGILLVMYNSRYVLTNQVVAELEKHHAGKLFNAKISRSVKIAEAPGFGMPICYFAPYSKGGLEYKKLASEITMRI